VRRIDGAYGDRNLVCSPDIGSGFLLAAIGAAVVVAGLVAGFSYLGWRRYTFWFDADGDLRIDQGVLTRTQTRVQLSRLQAVDVAQPLLARLVGLAEVRVDVAGTGESGARISFLTLADARALRSEVMARAAGVAVEAGEAPEQVLHVVPTPVLVKALLLRGSTVAAFVVTVVLVAGLVIAEGASGLILLVLVGGVPLFSVVGEFTRFFDFTVAVSPDGLRLRSGLLQTTAQTVPPGRVHALGLVEPWLWRRFGWVRVEVTLAATGAEDGAESASGVLLPVGTRAEAHAIIERLMPGALSEDPDWRSAPLTARWRAPLQYRRLAVARTSTALLTRSGWLTWRTTWVPHGRTQSVTLRQGPWQRRLGLATVRVDTVPGRVAVVAEQQEASTARSYVDAQAEASARARAQDTTTRWMRPPGAPDGPAGGDQASTGAVPGIPSE
jgi:putative membrane protein